MYIHALYVQLYVFIYKYNMYIHVSNLCFHIYKYISVLMYIHAYI